MSLIPKKYTTKQLDSLLLPTFLRGLTQAQQCASVTSNSSAARNFRKKSQQVVWAAKKAFDARLRGTCSANFVVPYTVSSGTLVVNWCSMADYFCHLQGAPVPGFPFVLSKALAFERNSKKCCPRGSYGGVK
jgi:hypothetical protein